MFLLYALNHTAHAHTSRFASGEPPLDANMDELPEIEDGLKELDEADQIGSARSGPYWSKIRAKVLSCSSTTDVEEALKEWDRDGAAWFSPQGTCELCGHRPISSHFPIANRVTKTRLVVGSECIYNYLQIPGFGTKEELRRRLNGERNRLKRKDKGELTERDVAIYQEAAELEAQLRSRFAHLASGEPDFDWKDYDNHLVEVSRVIKNINLSAPILGDITTVQTALRSLRRLHDTLSKRSKLLRTTGLLAMVSAVMRLRDDAKIGFLKQLQAAVNDMTKPGYPSAFIKRVWDSVKDEKANIIEKIEKSADMQRGRMKPYEFALDKMKPYEFLHFSIIAGLNTARKFVEKEADEAKALVMQEDFIDAISKKGNPVSVMLANATTDPMIRINHQMVTQAVALCQAPSLIEYGMSYSLETAIVRKYGLARAPKDRAGVKVTCFRALEDSIIDIEDRGAGKKLADLVEANNRQVIDIIEQEVDDIKALKLKKEDLWEFLSARWGFDVQKALKVFRRDHGFEQGFCESWLKNWERWPSLSPKQMAIVQKKLAQRDKEVDDNMWDVLKSEMTKPAPVG